MMSGSNADLEAIKEKIRALLAKTVDNGCTQAEAEFALAKASELMAKYMIKEHELGVKHKFITRKAIIFKSKIDNSLLGSVLCPLFNTEHFYTGRRGAREDMYYFGTEQDVELCIYFFNLLQTTMFNETLNYRKTDDYFQLSKRLTPSAIATDFQKGFVVGISRKVDKLVREKQTDIITSTGTDLVVIKDAEVKDAFKDMHGNIKQEKVGDITDGVNIWAFSAGEDKGKAFNFNKGIASNGETKRIESL